MPSVLDLRATVVLFALLAPAAGAAAPTTAERLLGHWVLDEARSDAPEDALEDKLRKVTLAVPAGIDAPRGMDTGMETAQERYWAHIRDNSERRSTRNLQRLGTAYPLLTAATLDIERDPGGYRIVYDELLPRAVRPNPKGRVFSASGDELVADSLGHTLAYREADSLVLETDPPSGGKVIERFTVVGEPASLEYRIELDLRVLTEPVALTRVFTRAAAQ